MESAYPDLSVATAMTKARTAAESHMIAMDTLGEPWQEESVSELLWTNAAPVVHVSAFSKPQEGKVGADWLWWWVDASGEAFGMLIQAKRLHSRGRRAKFDFGYDTGKQMAHLIRTSDLLRVPAMYLLYFGGVEFRAGLTCGRPDHTPACAQCRRATTSVLTVMQASLFGVLDDKDSTRGAFGSSVALEDLVDPPAPSALQLMSLRGVEPPLDQLFSTGQKGARAVARQIFQSVLVDRMTQLSAATMTKQSLPADCVFDDLSDDEGHFGTPYLQHIGRGLRGTLPAYVHEAAVGAPPGWLLDAGVAGIVVTYC